MLLTSPRSKGGDSWEDSPGAGCQPFGARLGTNHQGQEAEQEVGTRPGGRPAPVRSDELVDDSKAPAGVPLWLCSTCSPGTHQSATAV